MLTVNRTTDAAPALIGWARLTVNRLLAVRLRGRIRLHFGGFDRPGPRCRCRHVAALSLAEPTIAIPGHKIVDRLAKPPRYEVKDAEHSPNVGNKPPGRRRAHERPVFAVVGPGLRGILPSR